MKTPSEGNPYNIDIPNKKTSNNPNPQTPKNNQTDTHTPKFLVYDDNEVQDQKNHPHLTLLGENHYRKTHSHKVYAIGYSKYVVQPTRSNCERNWFMDLPIHYG